MNKVKKSTEKMNLSKMLLVEERKQIVHKACIELINRGEKLTKDNISSETEKLNCPVPAKTLEGKYYKPIIDQFKNKPDANTLVSDEILKLRNYIRHQESIIEQLRNQNNTLKTALFGN